MHIQATNVYLENYNESLTFPKNNILGMRTKKLHYGFKFVTK